MGKPVPELPKKDEPAATKPGTAVDQLLLAADAGTAAPALLRVRHAAFSQGTGAVHDTGTAQGIRRAGRPQSRGGEEEIVTAGDVEVERTARQSSGCYLTRTTLSIRQTTS